MQQINFGIARKKLITLWLIFSVLIFLIYFIQTLMMRYEHHEAEVWEWLLRFIIPPLTLMIGVFINQVNAQPTIQEVDVFYFRLALSISFFFLIILFLSAIFIPIIHMQQNRNIPVFDHEKQKSIIDALKSYNIFLLPLQGLATLVLGFFFTKK
jgi:hypothetical protein